MPSLARAASRRPPSPGRGAFRPALHDPAYRRLRPLEPSGGHPAPRAPMLRAVPGLASLPFVLATLAFSPASRRGGGFGFPPVPVARSRRALPPLLAAGGCPWFGSLAVGGVLCPLCLVCPVSFPRCVPCSCLAGSAWRRGLALLSVCRSAAPGCRCPGSWPWCGSLPSPPPCASPAAGVAACRLAPVFARCAGFPVALRCRCRFARACRLVAPGCAPCWRFAPPPRWPVQAGRCWPASGFFLPLAGGGALCSAPAFGASLSPAFGFSASGPAFLAGFSWKNLAFQPLYIFSLFDKIYFNF